MTGFPSLYESAAEDIAINNCDILYSGAQNVICYNYFMEFFRNRLN